jgi:hypothetical protein
MPVFRVDIRCAGGFFGYLQKPTVKFSKDHVEFNFSEEEYDTLKHAINKGWILVSGKREEILATAYYIWCRSEKRPFIKFTKERQKCQCDLDTFTTDYDLTEKGVYEVEALFLQFAQFRGVAKRNRILDAGRNWSVCNYIPIDKVEEMGSSLLEIANTHRLPIWTDPIEDTNEMP